MHRSAWATLLLLTSSAILLAQKAQPAPDVPESKAAAAASAEKTVAPNEPVAPEEPPRTPSKPRVAAKERDQPLRPPRYGPVRPAQDRRAWVRGARERMQEARGRLKTSAGQTQPPVEPARGRPRLQSEASTASPTEPRPADSTSPAPGEPQAPDSAPPRP